MLELATMDHWWKLTARFAEYRRPSHSLLKDFGYMRLLEAFDTIRPKRLLEFGHGFNPTLLQHAQHTAQTYAVDDYQALPYFPPKDQWEQLYNDTIVANCPAVHLVRGLLGKDPLPELQPASFDMIASVSVVEELQGQPLHDLLAHCATLLAPGGVFVGTCDLMLKYPRQARYFFDACQRAGLVPTGPVPDSLEPDYRTLLLESPSVVMLTYQMAEGEHRTFSGHWTTGYFCAARAA